MDKVTIKDLWKIAKTNNQPLLGLSTDLATLDFMSDYLSKTEAFDRDIARERGFFYPTWNLNEEDSAADVFEQWQKDVYYYLYKNKENYQRLYDLISIQYEPLQNYDKHSYIETIEDGQDVLTDQIGARHTEDDIAQRQDTNAYGQKQISDVYGAVSESDVHGSKSTTSTDKIAGFNSTGYVNSNQGDINEGSQTDTHTEQSKTDTHTDAQHTDTLTTGAHLDKHDERAATDSHTTDYGKTTGVDEHTFGNIGVTTSQQMAQSEIDLWNSFKFYDILIGDIIKHLCNFYQPGEDCF